MIQYRDTEHIKYCSDELDKLLADYFAKTIAKEGMPPLDMNWPVYEKLQESRDLLLVTARYVSDLIGFATYFIFQHPHHQTIRCAQSDILATTLRKRGRGIGTTLISHAEDVLRERGVQYITHQFRTCYDTEPLFPKLGYRLEEQSYRKVL